MKTMLSIPRTISSNVSVASAIHASGLVRRSTPQVCTRGGVQRRGQTHSARLDLMMDAVPTTARPLVQHFGTRSSLDLKRLIDRSRMPWI